MVAFGWIVIGLALIVALGASAMSISRGSTVNLGLLFDRQLVFEGAGFLLVAGAVFAGLGYLGNRLGAVPRVTGAAPPIQPQETFTDRPHPVAPAPPRSASSEELAKAAATEARQHKVGVVWAVIFYTVLFAVVAAVTLGQIF